MDREELKARTKAFAVRVVKMTEALPRTRAADIVAQQVIRPATSVGANYRAACRGRSHREFTARIGVVAEEADDLTAIFTAASHTARRNRDRR